MLTNPFISQIWIFVASHFSIGKQNWGWTWSGEAPIIPGLVYAEGSSVLEKSSLARFEDVRVLASGNPTPPQQNVKEIYIVVLPIKVEFKQNWMQGCQIYGKGLFIWGPYFR